MISVVKFRILRLRFLFVGFFILNLSNSIQAQNIINLSISANADARIDRSVFTTNFGSDINYFTYPWGLNTKRFVLNFDLSQIPSNATILSAKVYLYSTSTYGNSRTVNVHRITS